MKDSTVLFVDDQQEILTLIERMLRDEEYTRIYANSGKEALEALKNRRIDVLVTDVMMSDMGGLELLELVKEQYPMTVRIVLSGFSQIPTILSAINKGNIYRYISKPWKVDDDSRKIITDAIEYSKLIKLNGEKRNQEWISTKDFIKYLDLKDEPYIIVARKKVRAFHTSLQGKCQEGQLLEELIFLKQENWEEIVFLNEIQIFLLGDKDD